MKGYKGFDKGLTCRGYNFKENNIFEEEKAEICKSGFHFCKNPLDILDYYDLIDTDGNIIDFAEVEALDKTFTDDNKKFCTKKIKIGAKLNLKEIIKTSFDFLWEENTKSGDESQIATSGYESKIATSGYESKIATSGDESKIATSGDGSQIATSGYWSKIATSGYGSKIATSGYGSRIATSGDESQIATSGDGSRIATSGYGSKIATSGYWSKIATSGYGSKIATSGYGSRIATSGDESQIATSGDGSRIATSGDGSKIALTGKNNVGANIGVYGMIKGKIGDWITLAEYNYDECCNCVCVCVKSAQIDGVSIKDRKSVV